MRKWLKSDSTLNEDSAAAAIANVTGGPASPTMSMPDDAKKGPVVRRYKKFGVTNETFMKLKPGLSEWRDVLNPAIFEENEILAFAESNLDHTIVIENSDTKALRAVYPYEVVKRPALESVNPPPAAPEPITESPPPPVPEPPSAPEPISTVVISATENKPNHKRWRFKILRDSEGRMSEIMAETI